MCFVAGGIHVIRCVHSPTTIRIVYVVLAAHMYNRGTTIAIHCKVLEALTALRFQSVMRVGIVMLASLVAGLIVHRFERRSIFHEPLV